MPTTLFIIEIVGTIVSVPLTFLSVKQSLETEGDGNLEIKHKKAYSPMFLYIAFLSIFLGCGIIIFATISAMGI